ncbi:MAG: hypothetical protein QNJ71_04275 [Acidimicrobiia bacterium]|nr:hypothetical protein [Acidimicrobiia bacterium]
MNDQDRDLIMALAAGQLEEADAAEAMTRIEANPELAAEYAAQVAALDALSAVPPVSLTASERSQLRTELMSQLRLETEAVPVAAAPKRSAWWRPVLGLAAAAAVVTAIVVLPGSLNQSSDDAAETGEALIAETTIDDGAAFDLQSAEAEGGAEAAPEATTTTISASADASTEESTVDDVSDELLAATKGQRDLEEVEGAVDDASVAGVSTFDLARTGSVDRCLEALQDELPRGDIIPLATSEGEGTEVLYVGVSGETGIEQVIAIALETCGVVDTSP